MNSVKVEGDRILTSMYLCKEYARSQATKTDNMRNIHKNVQKYYFLPLDTRKEMKTFTARIFSFRPCLYGLGTRDNPPPELPWAS